MIKAADFTKEEVEGILTYLRDLNSDQEKLTGTVQVAFDEFDSDKNGALDRKEMRHFLAHIFKEFKIHLPLTDEFVDSIFIAIDKNHNNKLEIDELVSYMSCIVSQLVPLYEKALEDK